MTTREKMQALGNISALALDQRLAALRQAQAMRQAIVDRIAALELAPVDTNLSLAAAQKAEVYYQMWADERRKQLNLSLARTTAVVLQAEAEARHVFARNSVLVALRARVETASQRRP
jgi:hypothetical protein